MSADPEELRSTFTSTAGGVMTEEAGAVTGELEIETSTSGEQLTVMVRYAGAEEWYTVAGGGIQPSEAPAGPHAESHARIVEYLSTPGKSVNGNETPVSLQGYSA